LKEIWTLIVHYLADRIISQYDRIAVGYSGSLITKTGKEWKKFPAVLAHDALILFIDAQVRVFCPQYMLLFTYNLNVGHRNYK